MKKIMKLNIAICDDNKLVLENEKALIEETLKEMGIPYKMDKSALKRLENNNKCIEFNTDRNVVNIPINKIIFICAENKKTTIVTVDEQFVVDRPYKAVKDMINSYFFYESHASYYVNLNYVKAYSPSHVKCGIGNHEYEIHMSRRKYTEFNKYFIDWMGEQK